LRSSMRQGALRRGFRGLGRKGAADTARMLEALNTRFLPNTVVIFRPGDRKAPRISRMAKFVNNYGMREGKATAYVCSGRTCKAPSTDPGEMLAALGR